jgi:hypothetical protein
LLAIALVGDAGTGNLFDYKQQNRAATARNDNRYRSWLMRFERDAAMKVKNSMHKGAHWVSPDTPVTRLAQMMREQDIGAIPVGENDRLIGMVTDRDIALAPALAGGENRCTKKAAEPVLSSRFEVRRENYSAPPAAASRASPASAFCFASRSSPVS